MLLINTFNKNKYYFREIKFWNTETLNNYFSNKQNLLSHCIAEEFPFYNYLNLNKTQR